MTAPLPADVQAVLAELDRLAPDTRGEDDDRVWLANFRAQTDTLARFAGAPDPAVSIRHIALPGGPSLRLYTPPRLEPGVLLHMHGGGGVAGSLTGHDPALRSLAAETGRRIVAPEYRLAPEAPFPAQLEDGLAALHWILAGDAAWIRDQPVFLSGDSIGGALVASMARAVDDATGIRGQVLLYPNTDLRMDVDWPSRGRHDGRIIAMSDLDRQIGLYLGDVAPHDPRASPLLTQSLAGLPPALVVSCGLDPLEDEAIAYAGRLSDAGVEVRHVRLDAALHGVLQMGARTLETVRLHAAVREWLDDRVRS